MYHFNDKSEEEIKNLLMKLKEESEKTGLNFNIQITKIMASGTIAAKSLQSCLTLCDPTDDSHQAPLSLGFSRQGHWSGLPLPSPKTTSKHFLTTCFSLRL